MQQISQNLQSIYHNYKAVPLILSAAVVIDYALTFYLAGSIERILKYEYSPTLVYAVEHDLVIPYLVFTVFFYYAAGYTVLKYLRDSGIYYVGVAIILLMSITHVLGGLSWYVLSACYSNAVLALSLTSVVITITVFGYEIIRQI
ncbi:MAG: hypothetical protein C4B59_00230 [Candidatus Methanogaster sp.]|uniref:Uncharacterized protein n=1 Tax=Candidatus Methanogaster sp. TaxID=3386292 RepID=A0AC61L6S2_9EURY|nr:MAG: hypothetical protein C4B59_00230 [ANME-2 cluster archaeon]